jgi:hypothetical protein
MLPLRIRIVFSSSASEKEFQDSRQKQLKALHVTTTPK